MRVVLSVFVVLLCLAAIWLIGRDLLPPKELRLAAGGRGGGYWQVAEQYRDILERDGIAVKILETAGSGENTELMGNGAADAALLQGGVAASPGAEALAAVFREPLFIFIRDGAGVDGNPGLWSGLRLAVGGPGSGTRIAADQFLDIAGVAGANTLLPVGGRDAAQLLLIDDADAAMFVAPLSAPYLQPLFEADNIRLLSLDHVPAIEGRLQHSVPVTLHAGAIRLDPLTPAQDVDLLAMTARLVAQGDLHPALVDRLVEAAREIHGGRDAITPDGTFPSTQALAMPVDVYAADLLRNGTSGLQAYLPYWIVAQISRVAILLLPVLFLLIPIFRLLPGIYSWRMRRKVFRHYQDISEIDQALARADMGALPLLHTRLDDIDRGLAKLKLPLPYRNLAYTARMHIELLKRQIDDRLIDGR